ncbi:MAG: plastocyanin/azurin family copper-binding protein [Solirubrobacteraceae bacterium]
MRRLGLLTIALVLALQTGAPAHPGHGPQVVAISEFAYAPQKVTVVAGDYVFWEWKGPDTNHTVTSDDGQGFAFDSPGGSDHKVDDRWSLQFTKPGTFTYHCRVHSFMKGTVVVLEAPAQPVATVAKLSKVSVAVAGRRLTVRFRVNQAVSMRALIRRASTGKTVKEFDFAGPPGANRRVLRLKGFKAGGYRLALIAVDSSGGNSTKPVLRSFTLR